jgi:replicative DNA helicase
VSDDKRKQARENLYDVMAEEGFLSHACHDPQLLVTYHDIIDGLTAERNELAKALYELASAGETLTGESLRLHKASEKAQGLFAKLAPLNPEASAKKLAEALRDVTARRELATAGAAAFSAASEGSDPAAASCEALEAATAKARFILQGHETAGGIHHVGDLSELVDDIAWRAKHPCEVKGIRFGFPKLETLLDGLQPAKLYLVGARPGVGKTALAGDIAVNLAGAGVGGVFFSCEMSKLQLQQRLLATSIGVNPTKSLHGALTRQELERLRKGITEMRKWPLWIDDTDRISIDLLCSRARHYVSVKGARFIIVDYIQLIRGNEPKSRLSKKEEVGEVSGKLKALSKELGVPVIALAQLKRTGNAYSSASSQTEIPKPNLESLKESGDLEQDADAVIFLHRDMAKSATEAEAIVAKNRSGGNGDVDLLFFNDTTSFQEAHTSTP